MSLSISLEIFEKWRVVDMANLSPAKQAEFEADKQESNRRYDAAFEEVLAHTSDAELSAFWSAFGAATFRELHDRIQMATAGASQASAQTNPMHMSQQGDLLGFVRDIVQEKLVMQGDSDQMTNPALDDNSEHSEQAEATRQQMKGKLQSKLSKGQGKLKLRSSRKTQALVEQRTFEDGAVLIKQGDPVSSSSPVYILKRGSVRIVVNGAEVATRTNTYIGEGAVLGSRRNADVVAKGEVECIAMDKRSFMVLGRELKQPAMQTQAGVGAWFKAADVADEEELAVV